MKEFTMISYNNKGKQIAYDYAAHTEQAYHIASLMFVQDNVAAVKIFLAGIKEPIATMNKN